MREHGISCLPVTKDDHLVGIITEHEFMAIAAQLIEERLRAQLDPRRRAASTVVDGPVFGGLPSALPSRDRSYPAPLVPRTVTAPPPTLADADIRAHVLFHHESAAPVVSSRRPERIIAEHDRGVPGPTMIFVAGLHGNEPAGLDAARDALRGARRIGRDRSRGRAFALIGNVPACAIGARLIDCRSQSRVRLHDDERARRARPRR